MDSPKKATTPARGIEPGRTAQAAPAGARDNLESTTAGSKPAHESAAAPGPATPAAGVAVARACADLGALLGIPADVRTWRRIRDELATLRQALHIEGEQTATEAARGLEDVAARVLDRHSVGEPDAGDGWVQCTACAAWCDWERDLEPEAVAIARVDHAGDCLLAMAWRAMGRPGAVGVLRP